MGCSRRGADPVPSVTRRQTARDFASVRIIRPDVLLCLTVTDGIWDPCHRREDHSLGPDHRQARSRETLRNRDELVRVVANFAGVKAAPQLQQSLFDGCLKVERVLRRRLEDAMLHQPGLLASRSNVHATTAMESLLTLASRSFHSRAALTSRRRKGRRDDSKFCFGIAKHLTAVGI
jgi:hypothetical protein